MEAGKDPLQQLGPGERHLFISLWLVLILAFAIWHFYPDFEKREVASPIPIEISRELKGRIEEAQLERSSPSQHWVHVRFDPGFLRTLPPDGHQLLLGYDLANDAKVVYRGAIRLELGRSENTAAELVLPNPERVYTRAIRIYLPQR